MILQTPPLVVYYQPEEAMLQPRSQENNEMEETLRMEETENAAAGSANDNEQSVDFRSISPSTMLQRSGRMQSSTDSEANLQYLSI